jgi:NNP family nitrate/nitrite transporter-like MFS transporter
MSERAKAWTVLTMNTLAFTVCFAVWMMNGVLVTFLVDNRVFAFDKAEMGWLIGLPVLTGALLRLPAGILTDRFGGRVVFPAVLLVAAVAAYFTSFANGFWGFALGGLGFGIAGSSFAVGVAYTTSWFPTGQQGTALGLFGMGNVGAALTSIAAPYLLQALSGNGAHVESWRLLPRLYAAALVATAIAFWLFTYTREGLPRASKSLAQRLAPLRIERVWRFGLYYLLVFGGFVALAQWLIPYYVNVYSVSVSAAGVLAATFSLPSGLIRAFGGWLSDRYGARRVMYWVLGGCCACCALLAVPRMDVFAPGEGIMAASEGGVDEVSPRSIVVAGKAYPLEVRPDRVVDDRDVLVWPAWNSWHEPAVKPGDAVVRKQLLARGVTHIYFQANRNIFTGLALLLAMFMGIGMAAVYKYIPTYFPADVGVVGGLVGVIGGLGGFVFPIVFGTLVGVSGIWTTCWILLFALSATCLVWMHRVVTGMMSDSLPRLSREMEQPAIARDMEQLAQEMEGLAKRLRRRGPGDA